MRANDGTRTGGEILIDQLVVHGVQHAFCVPGESYLAALDAFYDRPIKLTVCRQEGGAAMMAEAIGKVTGRPGIVFCTRGPGATNASPGIHIARAGFDAADRVRRPGRARDARARGVPGTRLPRGVRLDRQMGDRDRRPGAHPGDRVARVLHRLQRPARPGGGGAAGGHAGRAGGGARCPAVRAGRDLAGPGRHGEIAEASLGGEGAGRARRRQPLVGGRLRGAGALRRALRHSGRHHLPPHAPDRHAASELRRRRRHRHQPEASGAHQGVRSDRADRRKARRDSVAELFAARHPRTAADAGACASRRRGTRPGLSSASGDPRCADHVRCGAGGIAAAERDFLARADHGGARRLSGLDREGDTAARRRQSRRDRGVAARQSPGGRLHHHRRRQFFCLGPSLLSVPPLRHPLRSDARARWAMACHRRLASSARSPSARWCASPATATS